LQEPELGAYGAVFGHVAAGLSHEPHRRVRSGLAAAGREKRGRLHRGLQYVAGQGESRPARPQVRPAICRDARWRPGTMGDEARERGESALAETQVVTD